MASWHANLHHVCLQSTGREAACDTPTLVAGEMLRFLVLHQDLFKLELPVTMEAPHRQHYLLVLLEGSLPPMQRGIVFCSFMFFVEV